MRVFSVKLALACVILISGFGLLSTQGSPAAYTETRSFRDALEGRSMEEAMSGPVDKDTSSYGERTASGVSGAGSARGMQAASMMLNIPANGNLMGADEQQQQQQQKSTSGSELEREAPSGFDGSSMDSQQQKMLDSSSQTQAALMEMRARQQQKMMMIKNARQQMQQQQEQDSSTELSQAGETKGQMEQGFGEEQSKGPKRQQEQAKSPMTGEAEKYDRDQQQKQVGDSNGNQEEQQVMTFAGKGSSTEMSAEQLAKQRMMAAMLMTMSKAMNYQNSMSPASMQVSQTNYQTPMNSGASRKRPVKKMNADNMLMSTMVDMKSMMNSGSGNSMMLDEAAYKANSQSGDYNGYQNGRGGMRRANQRKSNSRKMSPAMVNTLLNNMMNSSSSKPSYSTGTPKPDAMAMLMKTAAGAELLTNMVASQSPMMNGASPAAREQYKRMMKAAIMKQVVASSNTGSINSYSAGANGMMTKSYSRQEQNSQGQQPSGSAKSTRSSLRGYAPNAMGASAAPAMSPMAMMMNYMNAQKSMNSPVEQEQQTSVTEPPSYSSDRASASRRSKTSGYGSERPQSMEQQMMVNSGNAQTGFGEDTPDTKSTARQSANKLAMLMSNGPAARGVAMVNRYSTLMSPSKQSGKSDSVQQKYRAQSYMGLSGMDQQQQQQQANLDAPTEGQMKEADSPVMSAMNNTPRPTMPSTTMMSNGMRPVMSYQSDKPSNAAAKGEQTQQKNDFDETSRPMQTMSYGQTTDNENGADNQQQQVDNNQNDQQVKGQQQVDENGAAAKGMAEPFAFNYKVEDDYGNEHYRKEESDKNGVVRGSYGYMDNNGLYRHVDYIADENGFRANVKSNEPGLSSETPKLSPSTSSVSTMDSSQMSRPASTMLGTSAQDSSTPSSQMMSQMLDVEQMMSVNDGNQQQQQLQQQQVPPSQTELSAEESRRRRA